MVIAKSTLLKRSYLCVAEMLLLFTVDRTEVHAAVCNEVTVRGDVALLIGQRFMQQCVMK
jgi:hypothetical protein